MFNDLQQRLCVCVFVCRIHGRIGASERASGSKQKVSQTLWLDLSKITSNRSCQPRTYQAFDVNAVDSLVGFQDGCHGLRL